MSFTYLSFNGLLRLLVLENKYILAATWVHSNAREIIQSRVNSYQEELKKPPILSEPGMGFSKR